jgi:hypothetical protein
VNSKTLVAEKFEFLAEDYAPTVPFAGIIGLSPKDDSAGPLFVMQLLKQRKIKYPVFAVLIAPDIGANLAYDASQESIFTIGGYAREAGAEA